MAGVRILAYCLMSNHIHLVAVPENEGSLAICMQRVHGRYAQYLNARRQRAGHLWQNRYFSCPLDEQHLWTALRYVELNPGGADRWRELIDCTRDNRDGEDRRTLRRATYAGRPLGSEEFVNQWKRTATAAA